MNKDLHRLEEKLNIHFQKQDLLIKALTHSSYANEKRLGKHKDYEQLEFLGDAVLELVTSDWLLNEYPDYAEGKLSKIRAAVVCENTLSQKAKDLHLDNYLFLGHGEELTGGREKKSILCDAVESLIGAIYQDAGFEKARDFILTYILNDATIPDYDYKSKLQEQLGSQSDYLHYEILNETGADNEKIFTVGVFLYDKKLATGTGTSKKRAEQECAYNYINIEKNKAV